MKYGREEEKRERVRKRVDKKEELWRNGVSKINLWRSNKPFAVADMSNSESPFCWQKNDEAFGKNLAKVSSTFQLEQASQYGSFTFASSWENPVAF